MRERERASELRQAPHERGRNDQLRERIKGMQYERERERMVLWGVISG